jgi:hypothetical protein
MDVLVLVSKNKFGMILQVQWAIIMITLTSLLIALDGGEKITGCVTQTLPSILMHQEDIYQIHLQNILALVFAG